MARPSITTSIYSIVVPLYNTARFLPDLLKSLEMQQGVGSDFELECVFVDDSSPDGAGQLARDWLERTGMPGRVLAQPNSGVSVARNNGFDHVTGDWVTFIDSDDFIAEDYVFSVHSFMSSLAESGSDISLISCNVVRYFEADEHYDFAHPLQAKFARGNRVRLLDQHPEFIQSQAASAFFPVEELRSSGVRFIEGLHVAEDALFVSSFLLTQSTPAIAAVADAKYFYRRRASADSAVDLFTDNPDFYFGRFSRGYLPVFERAAEVLGSVPRWLGQYFLYDMRWFFPREQTLGRKANHLTEPEKAEVLRLIAAALAYLDPQWVRDYSITDLNLEHRNLMLALMDAPLLSDGRVEVHSIDPHRDLVELRYYFTGERPEEVVSIGGQSARIVAAKARKPDYFGQNELRERILWVLAEDDLAVRLDGLQQQVLTVDLPDPQFSASRARMGFDLFEDPTALPVANKVDRPLIRRAVGRTLREAAAIAPKAFASTAYHRPGLALREPRVAKALQVYAQRPRVRSRFSNVWLLTDGTEAAGGSAEAVYWEVRRAHPDINAFIVLRKDSRDWARLTHAGARLLSYGSIEHKAALLHAEFVVSSGLNAELVRPIPERYYWGETAPWRFVYLHRGELSADASIRFNAVPITMVAVDSNAERRVLADDDTAYVLTNLQVRVTGLPQQDTIADSSAAVEDSVSHGSRTPQILPNFDSAASARVVKEIIALNRVPEK